LKFIAHILSAFFIFTLLSGKAQQYSFIPLSVEEGLAQTQVFDICSDEHGNIWFGTAGGASRFDGINFKSYSSKNGLNDNLVSNIISKNGFIWIATQQGISRIKDKQVVTFNLEEITEKNNISAIAINDNSLWVGIKDKGICQLKLKNNIPNIVDYTFHVPTENLNIINLFCD